MNDKDRKAKKPTGFYWALYSCVGVMLAVSAVIGWFNLRGTNGAENGKVNYEISDAADGAVVAVDGNRERPLAENPSYLAPNDRGINAAKSTPTPRPTAPTKALPANTPADKTSGVTIPEPDMNGNANASTEPRDRGTPVTSDKTPENAGQTAENPSGNETGEANGDSSGDSIGEKKGGVMFITITPPEKTFTAFADGDKMDWPLVGAVAMDYSTEHLVYDTTLEQFRTNETVCISADYGAPVCAAAAGKVTDVYDSYETGVTMTIDHGNGWTTTYSCLSPDVAVQTGDVVDRGQHIANVGNPPIFSVLLGDHLGFTVTKDASSVNPAYVLN